MFPRAPRFRSTRGNDVPGPNAYDPTEQEAHYKRGAMFERDARFRAASRLSDHGNANGASGADADTASTSKVKLDSRVLALEKDKAKLEAKLKASEERFEASAAALTESQREKKQLQTDLRLLSQKQERLQTQNASHSKGQAQRHDAAQQLKHRVEQLETERASYTAHVDRLNASYSRSETEKFAANEVITGLRRRLKEAVELNERQTEHVKSLERSLQEERISRVTAQESLEDLQAVHRSTMDKMEQSEAEQRSQLDVLAKTNKLLAENLDDYDDQQNDAVRQRAALLKACFLIENERKGLRDRLDEALVTVRIREMHIRRLSYLNGVHDIKEHGPATTEVIEIEDNSHICATNNERSLPDEEFWVEDELLRQLHTDEHDMQAQIRTLDEQRMSVENDIQSEVSELKDRIIERLHSELKSADTQQRANLLERQSQSELHEALEAAQENLATVEEAYEAGVLDVMQSHEQIELLQGQLNRSKADVGSMMSRVEAFDRLQIELRNSRLRETALNIERQELLEDLSRSSNYEAAYFGIRAEAHRLIDRLSAREIQTQELTSLNAALASNKNPHQKINYLERIRTQLDEARIECREMEQERNALHRQCRDLQAQLDTFTHVDTGPGSVLSRHQAALNAAPLDEREAARRAWQMRPKTRFTRIGRNLAPNDDADAGDNSFGRNGAQTRPRLRERPSRGALSDRSNELARSLDNKRVVVQDESGEVTMLHGSDVTLNDDLEAPKRRALRARKSDTALRDRSSPVATLPSFDALAWELDKDHLAPPYRPQPYYQDSHSRSSTPTHFRVPNVLDGELSLADLTGT